MVRVIYLSILIFIVACGNVKRRNIDEYYVPSGTAKYILPEISKWYNFSESGQCFRSEVMKTLEFGALKKSFGIEYERAVQLQVGFNLERQKLIEQARINVLPVKDEERVFFSNSDKVQSNVKFVKVPSYDRLHFIWIDLALSKPAYLQKIKNFINSDKMDLGYPIFTSLCMSTKKLEAFVKKEFRVSSYRVLGFEVLNQFNANSERVPYMHVDLDQLMGRRKRMFFFSPDGKIPTEYKGRLRKL